MRSTMQDVPLSIASILKHGRDVYGDSSIITVGEQGNRRATFVEVSANAARLANGLRSLGIQGDARVGTFMWNNQEHMEAYLAIPSMGAVLHTLNIRLFPEQVSYIATHAEDQVVIADCSVLPLLARCINDMPTVHTVVVAGEGDTSAIASAGKQIVSYADLLSGGATSYDWPDVDERDAAAMCYTSGTTGNPKGVVYSHRSMTLHAIRTMLAETIPLSGAEVVLPVVPMFHANAWGLAHAAVMSGSSLVLPGPDLSPPAIASLIEDEGVTLAAGVPTIWSGVLGELDGRDTSRLTRIVCGGSAVPKSLSEAYRERTGRPILQAWGMTETSPI